MIPVEAVEAAAASWLNNWDANMDGVPWVVRERMQDALEAASPYMLAGAKANALIEAAEVAERGEGGGHDSGECDDWGAWLRARAANERAAK